MDLYSSFQSVFFSEKFWMVENVTWEDFKNRPDDDIYIPQPRDLWMIFPMAVVIFCIRLLFERYVAYHLGAYYGISSKVVTANPNPQLEALYKKTHYPSDQEILAISKQCDMSERAIQRWVRRRRNQDRPSSMTKLTETAWRCFFYLLIHIYGLYTVSRHVPDDIYWYYIVELAFYLSLLFSQFADVKRKDFWEQCIHHVATIQLMCFSWFVNYVRVGSLILCLHDAADYLLEGAKLARYVNKRTLCDVLFALFTLNWLLTRLMLYPYVILWTTGVDSFEMVGHHQALYLFNFLLWILQLLHIFWFILIMRVAIMALVSGKVEKDVRSASEESGDESISTVPPKSQGSPAGNGVTSS